MFIIGLPSSVKAPPFGLSSVAVFLSIATFFTTPFGSLGLFRQQLVVSHQIPSYNRMGFPMYLTVNSLIPYA